MRAFGNSPFIQSQPIMLARFYRLYTTMPRLHVTPAHCEILLQQAAFEIGVIHCDQWATNSKGSSKDELQLPSGRTVSLSIRRFPV